MRIIILTLLLALIPVSIAFAGPLDGPIVPKCSGVGEFSEACNLCDGLQLVRNLINFAVAFSTIVATVLFVYAGFLYFTASAKQDNIKKAHGIFWKVFIGFILILGAWLIVDLIMSVLINEKKFGPWNDLPCSGSSVTRQATSPLPFQPQQPSRPQGALSSPPSSSESVSPQPWCLEIDGESQCFQTLTGCTIAFSIAEKSGASPSECSSQPTQPTQQVTSPPQEDAPQQAASSPSENAPKKSYKEMSTQELTNLFYDMQASFVYRFQLENAAHSILWKTSFPWRVAVKDGAEIVSLRVFPGSAVVGMTYITKDGNQKTCDGSYGDWGTTSKDSAVTSLRGLFDEVCKTTASDDPIRDVIGC